MAGKRIPQLSKGAIKTIEIAVGDLVDRLKLRFLGPKSIGKQISIQFKREASLPGLYEAGAATEGTIPDLTVLDGLLKVADGHIEGIGESAKAYVIDAVQSFLRQAHVGKEPLDYRAALGDHLTEMWDSFSHRLERVLDTEATKVRNVSVLEGILQINANRGIDDPVVYWVCVKDKDLCDICRKLHLMGDNHTPRLWYMSEASHTFYDKDDPRPSISGLHPWDRCSLVTLLPGWGLDAAGKAEFKHFGYDAMKVQRG